MALSKNAILRPSSPPGAAPRRPSLHLTSMILSIHQSAVEINRCLFTQVISRPRATLSCNITLPFEDRSSLPRTGPCLRGHPVLICLHNNLTSYPLRRDRGAVRNITSNSTRWFDTEPRNYSPAHHSLKRPHWNQNLQRSILLWENIARRQDGRSSRRWRLRS